MVSRGALSRPVRGKELWASGWLVCLVCEDHGSRHTQDGAAPAGGEVADEGELSSGA